MNISEAKQIRLVEFLRIIGYAPVRVQGNRFWYLSPLREERTPSFKINDTLNEWYDFAIASGGNIIELGKLLYHTENVSEVLRHISESAAGIPTLQLRSIQAPPCPIEEEMQHIEVLPLSNYALRSYLRSRYIPESIGTAYCKEIHYELRKRHYFAIAFENQSGGYEVRNPYYKGCIKTKDITLIRHDSGCKQENVCVFEGFMDFLSYLTLKQKGDYYICIDTPTDYLVMNSVSNLKKCLMELESYTTIHCYLDNDTAGKKTTETIAGMYGNKVADASARYPNYKDLNDYLRGKRR